MGTYCCYTNSKHVRNLHRVNEMNYQRINPLWMCKIMYDTNRRSHHFSPNTEKSNQCAPLDMGSHLFYESIAYLEYRWNPSPVFRPSRPLDTSFSKLGQGV